MIYFDPYWNPWNNSTVLQDESSDNKKSAPGVANAKLVENGQSKFTTGIQFWYVCGQPLFKLLYLAIAVDKLNNIIALHTLCTLFINLNVFIKRFLELFCSSDILATTFIELENLIFIIWTYMSRTNVEAEQVRFTLFVVCRHQVSRIFSCNFLVMQ